MDNRRKHMCAHNNAYTAIRMKQMCAYVNEIVIIVFARKEVNTGLFNLYVVHRLENL